MFELNFLILNIQTKQKKSYTMQVMYLEIYNETIFDLLVSNVKILNFKI